MSSVPFSKGYNPGVSYAQFLQWVNGKRKQPPSDRSLANMYINYLKVTGQERHIWQINELDKSRPIGRLMKVSFAGPGTRLDKRLGPDGKPTAKSQPITAVDRISFTHDLAYRSKDPKVRTAADKKMLSSLQRYIKSAAYKKAPALNKFITKFVFNVIALKVQMESKKPLDKKIFKL